MCPSGHVQNESTATLQSGCHSDAAESIKPACESEDGINLAFL